MMLLRCLLLLVVLMAATAVSVMDKRVYVVHMDKNKVVGDDYRGFYQAIIESVDDFLSEDGDQDEGNSASELLYVYEAAISGFAAKMSGKHVELLKTMDGFVSAVPDEMLMLHTTHSPQFLGLEVGKGLWGTNNLAKDVIVGVIDTGVWPEHVSFQDKNMPLAPANWRGVCEEGTGFSKSNCNGKLVGARAFYQAYEKSVGRINETLDYRSPRDAEGHGTHTASTAAGNLVENASFFGLAKGSAAGMRYMSRIAAYKACWSLGCSSTDILAAIDKAVLDGVDVLSLSLGGSSRPYYTDLIAIASFGAIQKGVFVSCSAGNSGPRSSTVSNTAPWLMTVAASYTDRSFPAVVKLGNGKSFEGSSLIDHLSTKETPIVFGKTAGGDGAEYCVDGSLKQAWVKGKIVVCQRGLNSRVAKGEVVKSAKGAGMILINTDNEGEELLADAHVLPAVTLGAAAGNAIKTYLNSSKKPSAAITFYSTVVGKTAPIVAGFSSRGPNTVDPTVIKPDITAPGVNILAAWPPKTSPSMLKSDKRSVLFNIISGTSMSCPHVSGLAALLKSVHQDWSPAAIKSAFMTTAYTLDNTNKPITDVGSKISSSATPFSFGSGHIDPERAADPGLIYDITPENYLNYLCSLKYTPAQIKLFSDNFTCPQKPKSLPENLNYPSFAVIFKTNATNKTVKHQRTVTNVGTATGSYTVNIEQPNGVSVTVKPEILNFNEIGQKLSYKVTFVAATSSSSSSFGSLTWVSEKYTVRSPIAVTWQ